MKQTLNLTETKNDPGVRVGQPTAGYAPTLLHGDCLEVMRGMEAASVDAIVTDPPYFRVKVDDWDNQWDDANHFIEWVGQLCEQFQRILKPNGSLYFFASPQMAARVECEIRKRFNVLNSVVWRKGNAGRKVVSRGNAACKEVSRRWFAVTERVIFAEQHNSDNFARGEESYLSACDGARGLVFEPIRAYLAAERDRAGWTTRRVAEAFQVKTGSRTVTGMARHWFERVQWAMPTAENYEWLRTLFSGEYLRREYEELRREYEELRREYEELRRPFNVTAKDQWGDVWDFAPVSAYAGKHPCEKPQSLLRHILYASTKPDALVFDPFMGGGSLGHACHETGRRFIGIERDEKYFEIAQNRIIGV